MSAVQQLHHIRIISRIGWFLWKMPTTRSQALGTSETERPLQSASSRPPKRKASDAQSAAAKKQKKNVEKDDTNGNTITINRAPVLELWASCVAHLTYPSLPWPTCLSIGAAISTITAISKGRSIGKIQKPDPGEAAAKKRKPEQSKANLDEVDVMGFTLHVDGDGQAMVGDKPKKGNEEALKKKYGLENFEHAKRAFEDALQTWKGKEDDLNSGAFHMYEDFRPTVAAGQKGWGRKGVLNLETVKKAVRNS
jgi:hypothetical protein